MNLNLDKNLSTEIFELYQNASTKEVKSVMREVYKSVIVDKIKESRGFTNNLAVPKLIKVVLNVGFGTEHKKDVDYVKDCLMSVTGQLPRVNKARKSVSNFKVREGDAIGMMVTLRNDRMYHFLEKLLFLNLVRIPNFNGFSSKSFDKKGNFSFGIPKHSIFSEEIKNCRLDFDFGMDITIVTSAFNDEDAKLLLSNLGFIFN
jgi:large subunit ribosomal protein L5